MTPPLLFHFGNFQLDPSNACLWRGNKKLPLMPKDFALLHYLAAHAGQLVTKDDLFQAVWGETRVSAGVLKNSVERLRRTLGDSAKTPRFIETVHRWGYRFLPAVTAAPVSGSGFQVPGAMAEERHVKHGTWNVERETPLVGRDAELSHLHRLLDKAGNGERQLVFITGEPGIGKTALLEAFTSKVQSPRFKVTESPESQEESQNAKVKTQKSKMGDRNWELGLSSSPAQSLDPKSQFPTPAPLVAEGQCIEQYGSREPYLPVLEALGRLCRMPDGEQIKAVLHQHAPTWLMQMSALLSTAELRALQPRVLGATRERMLREFAEAIEVLTTDRLLILALEDLHWADASTVELLAALARRREPARLLVLGTYRPTEVLGSGHPLDGLTHELSAHRLSAEVALRALGKEDIEAYLRRRFPRGVFPTRLAEVLHRRTEGTPLFLVGIVDELVAQGVISQTDDTWVLQAEDARLTTAVPESVRHLVARQRERLAPPDRQVVEAASIAGMEFSVASVAAALDLEIIAVGALCAQLAERQQFLRPAGIAKWPDGTVAARYGFLHALYQQLWHERIPIEQQQQWHLRIGERKELAYGARAGEIAGELALHFEQGQDYGKAAQYLQQAGENAVRRSAYQESMVALTRGLELLATLPDTPDRALQEIKLQIALGPVLIAIKGYGTEEVEKTYARALELYNRIGKTPQLFPVLFGLRGYYLTRAQYKTARQLAEQCLTLAEHTQDSALLVLSSFGLGATLYFLGEFTLAHRHLEQGITLYNPKRHNPHVLPTAQDPGVTCRTYGAFVLWTLGYPDQALKRSPEALTLAKEVSHPFSLVWALYLTLNVHLFRGEGKEAQELAETSVALATEQGFVVFAARGAFDQGYALVEQGRQAEGISLMRQSLTDLRAIGSYPGHSLQLARLAEAYGKAGQADEGFTLLTEALAFMNEHEERVAEAELYRLKGELVLRSGVRGLASKNPKSQISDPRAQSGAEIYFLRAIEIAQKQQAKSWELRATTSLARLWQRQGKCAEAHRLLSVIYNWFTEGFDTKDLQEAKTLLNNLA